MLKGVVLTVLALALCAHPAAADATIYGCVNPRTNRVRLIVTSPPTCRALELPISWNQVGPQGDPGPQGPAGPQGPQGPQGLSGPPGTALAYAYVNADGTIDEASSHNVTPANVARVDVGIYCFVGLPFTPHSVVASPTATALVETHLAPAVDSQCIGAQFEVVTHFISAAPGNFSFMVNIN